MTIMMNEKFPWVKISKPSAGYNVLLVDPDHPHDFFWGRDSEGYYLLVLDIDEDGYEEFLKKKTIDFKGIKTDLRISQDGKKHVFVLSLQRQADADIFLCICNDLIEFTKKVEGNRATVQKIHTRLQVWRAFLSKNSRYLLSEQEVRGLFAELVFLENCINNNIYTPASIITGWQGPLDGPHDFVLGDIAVEVKSIASSSKNTVRISSENQLVTNLSRLYLQVFFLAEYTDGSSGISLNDIVGRLRNRLEDTDFLDTFNNRLHSAGYIDLIDYATPLFSVIKKHAYEVSEGFPRIIPLMLSSGLRNVSYDLDLNMVEAFCIAFPLDERGI
jgi:hypothetical protein